MNKAGRVVVLSSPSGGGKTSILRSLLSLKNPQHRYSVSVTTRPMRKGEVDGVDYSFLSEESFLEKCKLNAFLEWEEVHGNYYGTPKDSIQEWVEQGFIVFCDIDVHGGLALKRAFGREALLIFIRPPSFEVLAERLRNRNTESDEDIQKRLERYSGEMRIAEEYDCQIVNETIEGTVNEVLEVVAQSCESH